MSRFAHQGPRSMEQYEPADDVSILRMVNGRLAAIYHDLNNPLAVASGNVQFMAEAIRAGDIDGLAEALADVRSALEMLERGLGDVMDLRQAVEGRIASGGTG